MKKILLSGMVALASTQINAQDVLETANFEDFTLGNAAGQNTYELYNGTAADYQITNIDEAHGQSLTITGSGGSASAAASRYFFKAGLGDAWYDRAAENNILRGELSIFTGTSTSTTGGRAASYIYDIGGNGVVGISFDAATRKFTGFLGLKLKSTGIVGGYGLTFSTPPPTTIPANTWVKVSYMYDSETGAGTFGFPDGTTYKWDNSSNDTVTIVPFVDPEEHDFIVTTNASVARSYSFDDLKIVATNKDLVMSTNDKVIKGEISRISIYPNPTTDVINISNIKKLISYTIYDASGKVVDSKKTSETAINVSNLSKGAYVIHIQSEEFGLDTRKFIKK